MQDVAQSYEFPRWGRSCFVFVVVSVLQKPSWFLASHSCSCPLLDWWLRAKVMKKKKTHEKSPVHRPKKSCDDSFVKVPGIPGINLFINNDYETVENKMRAFLVMTSLRLKRLLNRSFISPHHLAFRSSRFFQFVEMEQEITDSISIALLSSSFLQLTGGDF